MNSGAPTETQRGDHAPRADPEVTRATRDRAVTAGLIVAAVGFVVLVISAFFSLSGFFHGYLAAYVFWLGVPLGAGGFIMIHHLTAGRWGWTIRRPAEATLVTLPLLAVLFVPILIGLTWLYPWAATYPKGVSVTLTHQRQYMNVPFFLVRAVIYFALWLGGAAWLYRKTTRGTYAQPFASAGLILLVLTVTFAGVDWLLSLEAMWFSTVFGFYVLMGFGAAGLCTMIVVIAWPLRGRELSKPQQVVLGDLGNILLTFIVLHTYMSFSQFFIIWNGNTKHEILWYVPRERGIWGVMGVTLIFLFFLMPFFALLGRAVKRNPRPLIGAAILVLVAQCVSCMWMVLPSMDRQGDWGVGLASLIPTLGALGGIGGLWVAMFAWAWRRVELADPEDGSRQSVFEPQEAGA